VTDFYTPDAMAGTELSSVPAIRGLTPFGAPSPTSMACGAFTLQAWAAHPLKALLPPVIYVGGTASEPVPWAGQAQAATGAEHDAATPSSTRGRAILPRR
jgi:hypothetical protein